MHWIRIWDEDTEQYVAFQALKGDKGDPGEVQFESLTAEQRAELKGEKGDPFTFADLTEAQKAELKGEPFTYDDLTEEQKAEIVGLQGPKGDTPVKGVDYFTAADKAELIDAVLAELPSFEGGTEDL